MSSSVIKNTKSLSPLTYEETDARVVEEDGKVYLEKQDENRKPYKALIDSDYDFYRLMTGDPVTSQVDFNAIHLYVSARCNLTCPFCYEDLSRTREPSLSEIEELLSKYKNKIVVLMGREPTCREDILDVIKSVNKQNRSCLLTNGINLAKYEYVLKLKDAGLNSITFSFNGFDDDVYTKMNGKPLLKVKLKALENIKKVGIKTILSVTMARGVNDNQLKKLCDFCFENRSFIYELRVRSTSPVGRHLDLEPFCMSEMIDIVTRELGIRKEDVLKEQAFWKEFISEMKLLVPETVKIFSRNRLCSLNFHVKKDIGDKYICLGSYLDVDKTRKGAPGKPMMVSQLIRAYGIRYIIQNMAFLLKMPIKIEAANNLLVVLRCWPNIYNVDMDEIRKCPSEYYKNGKFSPFCYSNIMEDKGHLEENAH